MENNDFLTNQLKLSFAVSNPWGIKSNVQFVNLLVFYLLDKFIRCATKTPFSSLILVSFSIFTEILRNVSQNIDHTFISHGCISHILQKYLKGY